MKIYLSTPCYGGLCLEQYAESIINLQVELIKHNIILYIDTTENESLVHRARNVAVGRFMQKSDADYFMFIDADIHFHPSGVLNLINGNHDVAVACYPKKYVDWEQAKHGIKNGEDKPMAMMSSNLVVNFGSRQLSVQDNFIKVLDGPTGFMLIKRSVFEKMEKAYPELYCVNDHQNRDFENYYALFDCMIDPETKRYLSEDYAFCRRWQQIGGDIYAHINTTLGHVGNLPFSGSMSERLKDVKRKNNNEHKNNCSDPQQVGVGENPSHNPETECVVHDQQA